MPHRAAHRKSHNGCSACKRRHVRCDEKLPQCTACLKRSLRCDFLDGAPLALLSGHKCRAILPIPAGGGRPPHAEVPAEATTRGLLTGSKDLATSSRCWEPHEVPTLCVQIGGFCNDPFSTFPVESKTYLASAYGYYATVYIPAAFRLANIIGDIPFFYSRILQDAMQFDAMIALVLTVQRIHLAINDRMSPAILQHVGLATTALRKRLLSGKDITSDAVFCTMFRLLTIQHFVGNAEALEIHVNGLKQLVKLCGGIENLRGLRGYIKSTVIKTFAAYSAFQRTREIDLQNVEVQQELIYPERPFHADLCRKVTVFPDGFRDLTLSGKLSLQCIHYVHLVLQLSRNKGYDVLSLAWDELLGKPGLSVLERLLGSTLSAYTVLVCSERQVASPNPAWLAYIHQQIERIVSSPDLDFCDQDFVDWTCLMLRATTEKETMSWRWANAQLKSRIVSDDRRDELSNAFIPIAGGASVLTSSRSGDIIDQQLLLPEPGHPFLGCLTHNGYSRFILTM